MGWFLGTSGEVFRGERFLSDISWGFHGPLLTRFTDYLTAVPVPVVRCASRRGRNLAGTLSIPMPSQSKVAIPCPLRVAGMRGAHPSCSVLRGALTALLEQASCDFTVVDVLCAHRRCAAANSPCLPALQGAAPTETGRSAQLHTLCTAAMRVRVRVCAPMRVRSKLTHMARFARESAGCADVISQVWQVWRELSVRSAPL